MPCASDEAGIDIAPDRPNADKFGNKEKDMSNSNSGGLYCLLAISKPTHAANTSHHLAAQKSVLTDTALNQTKKNLIFELIENAHLFAAALSYLSEPAQHPTPFHAIFQDPSPERRNAASALTPVHTDLAPSKAFDTAASPHAVNAI